MISHLASGVTLGSVYVIRRIFKNPAADPAEFRKSGGFLGFFGFI
jgi:hypothetical protein